MTPSGSATKKELATEPAPHGGARAEEDAGQLTPTSLSFGWRLVLEVASLLGLTLVELGWWEIRGRYSVAPDSSELVDGSRFIGLTAGIYLSARVVFYVLGKALSMVHEAGALTVALFYTGMVGMSGGGLYLSGLGAQLLEWGQKNLLGDNLTRYLVGQIPELKQHGYSYLRLLALIIIWQCIFAIIYWAGALLLMPFRLVVSSVSKPQGSSKRPGKEVAMDDE